MEVLRPQLINIKGRIYRRNNTKEDQYEEEEELSYMDTAGELSESDPHTQAQLFKNIHYWSVLIYTCHFFCIFILLFYMKAVNTLKKMRHVIFTTLSRLIKDSAVPLMSQVFFTS